MAMMNKRTESLSREELKKILSVARGETPCDLLIKNVRILDLVNGQESDSAIALSGSSIAGVGLEYLEQKALRVYDAGGRVAVPGFIDGHVHIESSMMHPFEFERLVLPLGTTTALCDPHEITNVLGDQGFSWFLRCALEMQMNLFVQVSSCVPALEGHETNGGTFQLEQMLPHRQHPHVIGLAEMMNFPGVAFGDDRVLDKLSAFNGMNLDGHCPLVRGKMLNAYLAAGIQNCHETVTPDEGYEKLQKGMALIIREGSVAKNLETLAPLVTEFNSPQCLLCTDDRNPYEIFNEGHINYLIKLLIKKVGLPPHVAFRLSSYSAAKHFNLKRLGLIAPGKQADIVFLDDLKEVKVADVLIAGQFVSELDLKSKVAKKLQLSEPPIQNTMKRDLIKDSDFFIKYHPGVYNVIEIIPNEIITKHLKVEHDGDSFKLDDIKKIAVVERYGKNSPISQGLVRGMGLERGAIASSVAHDSHNIIVIGTNDADMAFAVNSLIKAGGGFCVVNNEKLMASLDLPVAGLLSLQSAESITEKVAQLKVAFKELGVKLHEPFIQMAFLALPVIPSLKITDMGLFDVSTFSFIGVRD